MIGEYVAAHRRLANPNAAFYEQTVQSFAGEGYVFAASDVLEQEQRLKKNNSVEIHGHMARGRLVWISESLPASSLI